MDTLTSDAKSYLHEYKEILADMTEEMTGADMSRSISYSFTVRAVPHCLAAAEISETVLKYTESCGIKRIAEKIISEELKLMTAMQTIKRICREKENSSRELMLYYEEAGNIANDIFTEINGLYFDSDIDCDFLREMLAHHRAAIKMAENALKYPICDELAALLGKASESRRNRILRMEQLSANMICENCR